MIPAPDAPVRERALNPEGSFIVQAPAGSGKTELLTRRYLVLLGRVERPEEILAITFTRRAAAEMRERVLTAVERARAGAAADSPHEAETLELAGRVLRRSETLGWDLVRNPTRVRIHTIDAFMASLVSRMPWLSRLGPPPKIAARPEDLYEEAARRVLAHLDSGDLYADALARVLGHLDNQAADLRQLLVELLGRRDQWLRHRARLDPEAVRPELEQGLERTVRQGLARAEARLAPFPGELAALGRGAAANLPADHPLACLASVEGSPGTGPADLAAWQALAHLLLTGAGAWRKPGGVNKTLGFPAGRDPEARARLQAILEALSTDEAAREALAGVRGVPAPGYTAAQWEVLGALIRTVDLALACLWETMAERGEVDFAEVALRALGALGDRSGPSDLLLGLDRRLAHILVDEFQDTSHVQFALLERLAEGWVPGDGRTLFLVGDPMQSIYRFREADVGLFLRAWDEGVGPVRLEGLRLEANFRSTAGLVDWVNATFPRVFPARADGASGAVPYSPSVAVRSAEPPPAVEVRPALGADPAGEAAEVAEEARAALERGSAALLVRSRTHLPAILGALRSRGVPHQAQDLDPLAERSAVRDVVSLTRALLHPGDRLAWLAVLRAPWCGLDLADLLTLAGRDERLVPEQVVNPRVVETLSPEGRLRLERCWQVLAPALAEARRRSLRAWVEGAWWALGAPAYLPEQAIDDVDAVFALLEELDEAGELRPLQSLERRLRGLFARPDPLARDGLQVMTIHKAKGLEFDTVLVPGLGRPPRRAGRHLLYWLETPGEDLLLAPLPPRVAGARDAIADYIRGLESRREDQERCRLLYVAVTRARKKAILWGHAADGAAGGARPRSGSLLASLWPAVDELFQTVETSPAPPEEALRPRPLLHRLPLGWRRPGPNPSVHLAAAPAEPGAPERPEFEWAGETARHVGTVAHRWFERVADEGLDAWNPARIEAHRPWVRARLSALGAPGPELEPAVDRVAEAIRSALDDPKGRWILGPHPGAASELALTRLGGESFETRSVDRTFIDQEGTRWVVDFKTGTHGGGSVETFLAEEVERYRPQLAAYAALLRDLEPGRQVRAGLYFPLLRAWREVEV